MSQQEEDVDLIIGYIDGTLSAVEEEAFRRKLQSEAFRAMLQEQVTLVESLREVDDQMATAAFEEMLHRHTPAVKPRFNYWLAAGVALLLGIGFISYQWWAQSQTEAAIAAYYEPYPGPPLVRGEEPDPGSPESPFTAYTAGRYEQALPGLRAIAEEDPNINEVELMVGSCYLLLQDQANAVDWFNRLQDAQTQKLQEDGSWYLALAYWQANLKPEARTILENLATDSRHYQETAQNFLALID